MKNLPISVMLVTFVVGGILAPASPAVAGVSPPQHFVTMDLGFFALPNIDCGSFTIRETSYSGRFTMITYFNGAGEPIKVFEHTSFQGILTNLSSGATLRDHVADNSTFPILNGDFTVVTSTGVDFHYTVRHGGLQVAVTGRLVHDDTTGEVIFVAGPHDVAPHELPPICPLLA